LIRKISKKAFPELIKGFKNALGIVFLAKSTPPDFNKLKWLAIVFSFILGLVIYQWILMQEQNIRIEQFANYNPLNEIEQFESNEIFDIKLSDDDPLLGNVNAPVTMVVFSDFQCSLCEMFASNFKYLLDYNKGKLNIRFKYFPLSSTCNPLLKDKLHPLACESARAGEAARLQGKFWEYHDALFTYGHVKNEEQLFEIARNMNLEMTRFKVDYYSNRGTNKIEMDIQEGIRLNIEGTPTAFLNGRKLTNLSEKNINFLIKFLSKDF
jgi:protein-disulfide isomerase